jgi:glycosyltransferase involved in cell wall biosynthesis
MDHDDDATAIAAQPAAARSPTEILPPRPTVADGLSFIVHSHLRWDFVWQRPQQIFSRLAPNHRVLFIEEPVETGGADTLQLSEPHPNVVRAVPMLNGASRMSVERQHELFLPLLDQALKTDARLANRFHTFVQWFYSPMPAPCVLGKLPAAAVVYDCMDELANFRYAPADIGERERLLLGRAQVVFTGGYSLFQAKRQHHDNVHFYGCGVDAVHFGRARRQDVSVPDDIASLRRPVLGYFGVIDERLDYELIARLATSFPDASIVMVGPLAKVHAEQLPQHSNIRWLGQRAYADLPALVKGFDVCLMPFAMNEATRYINPTKTLEYMAAGKPIVSSAVPDVVRNFTPTVAVAHSHEQFVEHIVNALRRPERARIEDGIAQAEAASWEAIVASMRGHILQALAHSSTGLAIPARGGG